AFGQSSTKITSSHPLERLEVPPLTRKNKPAKGAQRDHKNHEPNHNQSPVIGHDQDTTTCDLKGVGCLSQVQGAQRVSKNNTTTTTGESRDNSKQNENQKELVSIRQTHGAQSALTNNNDRQHTLQNSNHDKSIIITINELEKEIEQYVKRTDQWSAENMINRLQCKSI
ncbi:21855_t:CDS:1, partial [Gigaspora rosea]